MIAVDTNILVRVFAGDNPKQIRTVRARIRGEKLWMSKTVLLELEWVLRFSYKQTRPAISRLFDRLAGYRLLVIEDRSRVMKALAWYRQGLDFADALHLSCSGSSSQFATFDRGLAKAAAKIPEAPPVLQL